MAISFPATLEDMEAEIMLLYPVTEGEQRCRNERRTMRELRQWKREQLQQQNLNAINAIRQQGSSQNSSPCGC